MPAPVIQEIQLSPDYSRGARGGAGWRTIIVATQGGQEQRVQQWADPRAAWTFSMDERDPTTFLPLLKFWYARGGRANGFRWKDWTDFSVTNENLFPTGAPPLNPVMGAPTVQLVKNYSDAGAAYVRNIYKPVASPAVTMRKNAGAFAGFTLDTTTGLAVLAALNSKSITAITQAASAVVTVGAAHGFSANDLIYFTSVAGMTQINGLVGTVTATGATTITVNIASTGFSAYTSGGTATKYLASTDVLDWSGQFDIPVRFDTDMAEFGMEDANIRSWQNVRVIELKGGTAPLLPGASAGTDPRSLPRQELILRSDNATLAALAGGATVTTWPDESGNSRTATPGGGFAAMTKAAGATPTGVAAVRSHGGDGAPMSQANGNFGGASIDNSQGYTFYLLFNELSTTTPGNNQQDMFDVQAAGFRFFTKDASGNNSLFVGSTLTGMVTATGWQMWTIVCPAPAGSTALWYLNGGLVAAGTWTGNLHDQYNLSGNNSGNIGFEGQYAYIAVFSQAHSQATRSAVEAFLQSTYGY